MSVASTTVRWLLLQEAEEVDVAVSLPRLASLKVPRGIPMLILSSSEWSLSSALWVSSFVTKADPPLVAVAVAEVAAAALHLASAPRAE